MEMKWLFNQRVIEARKSYKIWIKFCRVDGQTSLERRFGRILTSDNPETQAFDEHGLPTSVEIEYSDNKSKPSRKRFPVNCIAPIGPKNGSKLLIISGDNVGTVVKHVKTVKDNVKVKTLDDKVYTIPKNQVCAIELQP